MPISIYPPILQSSQPAFVPGTSYPIYFTLQQISDFDDIGHIQVRIVRQIDNISIIDKNKYDDGTIYKAPEQIDKELAPKYAIHILDNDLADGWKTGTQYKVQMRFGLNPMYSDKSEFASWKQEQIDTEAFSEWSTVMVIKAINRPKIYIENAEALADEQILSSDRMEPTLTPMFFGVCKPIETDNEIVDTYQFNLFEGEKVINDVNDPNFIETSGSLRHKTIPTANLAVKFNSGLLSSVDQYRFSHILENKKKYTVFYSTVTKNGYRSESAPYVFTVTQTNLGELRGFDLKVTGTEPYCRENGCINLYLKTYEARLNGSYVIIRSSEKTNYGVWEDIKYFTVKEKEYNNDLLFSDFTVESGIRYKYAIQQENSAGLRTTPKFEENNKSHYVDFEYSYLYHDKVQLRLMFNQKINSFKHTVLSSKQDTLGSKYPYLSRNGDAYYAEFPISGLISFQMDENQTFFEYREDGYYYEGKKIISSDKFEEGNAERLDDMIIYDKDGNIESVIPQIRRANEPLTISHNLTENNIFIERKFREKVEEFLNNFNYKLYKSPTEGNIVVTLQNVTLTPNETLGRMLFEFSATAYEVLENTIENLDTSGIINIGEFQGLASKKIILSLGQVDNLYGANVDKNIYKRIVNQEETKIDGGGYRYQLERVRSIWIDRYPDSNFRGKITELKAKRSELNIKGESITEVDKEIKKYENLAEAIEKGWEESTVIISINGKNIIVAPRRIYALTYPITSLELVAADYPIVVNYICEKTTVEDLSIGVEIAIDLSRIWSQLAGVFTDTENVIMDGYRFDYGPGQPPLRVYSGSNSKIITYDKLGNVLLDSTNFNLYKSLNIFEIIKEETRRQVEFIYNLKDGFTYNEETERWENGPLVYEFSDIIYVDIEAEQNTVLMIGKKEDGSDAIKIRIGETGRYIVNPADNLIRYMVFETPTFAIINFKCLTKQTKLKRA